MTENLDKRAVQELAGKIVKQDQSIAGLDKANKRLKVRLAIEKDRVVGLQQSVEFYRRAFYIEFARTTPLTSAVSDVKLDANKEVRA